MPSRRKIRVAIMRHHRQPDCLIILVGNTRVGGCRKQGRHLVTVLETEVDPSVMTRAIKEALQ